MSLIEWQDNFNIGLAGVDHEHRQLIDLINRLHDELISGKDQDRIELFFGELYTAISAHFALEEKFMLDQHYDRYDSHKADHEQLLDEISDLMEEAATLPLESLSEALSERLKKWFERHFHGMDVHLHRVLGAGPG